MKPNNFEQQIAANEQAQKHAQEIQQTRVGGLGGSDAAIVYKIGLSGMKALTKTDMKRLAVMTGKAEQENWGGNAYTDAGHQFEDYAERVLPLGDNYEREKVFEQKLARNFRTFAHADFATGDNLENVIECKYVQAKTETVAERYNAQLQWYYMLGATSVTLYHGWGMVEPFEPEIGEVMEIERDDEFIKILLAGIKTLDSALEKGWEPDAYEKEDVANTPEAVQRAFEKLMTIKAQKAELAKQENEASEIVKRYIEEWGLSSIFSNGEIRHTVSYSRASVSLTFDAEKFLKEHPEFDRPEYYKKTNRKSSITFK